jgi:hypothetical protein
VAGVPKATRQARRGEHGVVIVEADVIDATTVDADGAAAAGLTAAGTRARGVAEAWGTTEGAFVVVDAVGTLGAGAEDLAHERAVVVIVAGHHVVVVVSDHHVVVVVPGHAVIAVVAAGAREEQGEERREDGEGRNRADARSEKRPQRGADTKEPKQKGAKQAWPPRTRAGSGSRSPDAAEGAVYRESP